jgi:hypothetical protein
LQPASVLDFGSGDGRCAVLAASLGKTVVAVDRDEGASSRLYREAKRRGLPILPVTMDFCEPTPGSGICNQEFAPATERLRCDLVMALDLVRELVFERELQFDNIADGLASFSNRWALVEFVPADGRAASRPWYGLDGLRRALGRRFDSVEVLPWSPHPRAVLLCEKSDAR